VNFIPSQVESGSPSAASPPNVPRHGPKHEQLDEALQALAIPFDLTVIPWALIEDARPDAQMPTTSTSALGWRQFPIR
jgi:hypothetical protein